MTPYLRALLGILFFCLVAWLLSNNKTRMPWRTIFWGFALQIILALFMFHGPGQAVFRAIADFVVKVVSMTVPGAQMVFGPLAGNDPDIGFIFAFAGTGLVSIIFFSALMAILYHLGVMQAVVWVMARAMTSLMRVSGAESLAAAVNIFVGQTEAALVIRPYVPTMTKSELHALMVAGFATIAGSVMVIYMKELGPTFAPHILVASVMAAPGSLVMAKIIFPETQSSQTAGHVPYHRDHTAHNLLEAAANGTSDGLKLWLNVIAMLIVFVALVALVNWPLGWIGEQLQIAGGLSLGRIFGWVLAPVAWLMGIHGWHDCQLFGSLLGTKISLNEFVAYLDLAKMLPQNTTPTPDETLTGVFQHQRSAIMATYALCGFANFSSIGIQLGGFTPLAPDRKTDFSRLALRAMLGGVMTSLITATIAGVFIS